MYFHDLMLENDGEKIIKIEHDVDLNQSNVLLLIRINEMFYLKSESMQCFILKVVSE